MSIKIKEISCEDTGKTLTQDEIPTPLGWKCVVKPDGAMKKVGNILMPDEAVASEKYFTSTGVLVAIGETAYCNKQTGKRWAGEWPEVGDRVIFARYAGKKAHINGVELIVCNDEDIVCKVNESTTVEAYVRNINQA